MFVLNSGRYASDPSGADTNLTELFERVGAEIVARSPWQDGKLAYPIDGHRKGLHYLVYFKMDGSQVTEMNRLCKLNDLILRHMVIEHSDTLFEMHSGALLQHVTGEGDTEDDGEARKKDAEPVAAG